MAAERFSLFATCAPGLEPALHAELRDLRCAKLERQVGGVYFEGDLRDVWRANLGLRTAVRVLCRVARFEAPDEGAFYRAAREVAWERFLGPEGTLAVTAHAADSKLFHTGFIAQLAKDAVVDRFRELTGARPSVDKQSPDLALRVHLVRDRCSLLLDTSGPSLHKRGWRRYQGPAPLAETLAAGLLLLSGWDRSSPLLDPFCGSGTLLVEAALLAAGRAPGAARAFAFERWPGHDAAGFAALRAEAAEPRPLPRKLVLRGSDADPRQIEGARENLASAGLLEGVELELADARAFAPRRGWNAWIATNPPYGERVGDARALAGLYRDFGQRLRAGAQGFHLALLTGGAGGGEPLAEALALGGLQRTALANGALKCVLLTGEIVAAGGAAADS